MVERYSYKVVVDGSNPSGSTKYYTVNNFRFFFTIVEAKKVQLTCESETFSLESSSLIFENGIFVGHSKLPLLS